MQTRAPPPRGSLEVYQMVSASVGDAATEADSLMEEGAPVYRSSGSSKPWWSRLIRLMQRWRSGALCAILIAGLVALTLVTTFLGGRYSAAPTECIPVPGLEGDTVAPEGSVTGRFEARYDYRGRPRSVTASLGVVTADHGRCSDMGLGILQAGGNAVDAAVTTALCQGVMNPAASGLGGGHFMLVRTPRGEAELVDAREVAPAAAHRDMFKGNPAASVDGGLAVAVPLELKGLHLAHSRHGKLSWSRLFEPVIPVARLGFAAHPFLVASISNINTTLLSTYTELRDTFFIKDKASWRPPAVNETCCARPALARVLEQVAQRGPDALYKGALAELLVADVAAAGGILAEADLSSAEALVRPVARMEALGLDLLVPPPPTSSLAVALALRVLTNYSLPLANSGSLGLHRTVEALKHAAALRLNLGDPGPPGGEGEALAASAVADVAGEAYAASLRRATRDDQVLDALAYGGSWNLSRAGARGDDHGTSHVNVVDAEGMAVSVTTSINLGFGSKVLSKSTGILLNNQMDDFSTPGQYNALDLPPSEKNFISPGKKPYSSMSPIIVEQGGRLRCVLGASGGPRIISAVVQTLLRVLAYNEHPLAAVGNPRLHQQLLPNTLFAEHWAAPPLTFDYSQSMLRALASKGHEIGSTNWGAAVQGVFFEEDWTAAVSKTRMIAVSDPRKDGASAGY